MSNGLHNTAADLIAAWDRGETIVTFDMSGFGDEYEQALQTAAVEFARAGIASGWKPAGPVNGGSDKALDAADAVAWDDICKKRCGEIDKALGYLSGAMYRAARWLAYRWVYAETPLALIQRAQREGKTERIIKCVRNPDFKLPPMAEKGGSQ